MLLAHDLRGLTAVRPLLSQHVSFADSSGCANGQMGCAESVLCRRPCDDGGYRHSLYRRPKWHVLTASDRRHLTRCCSVCLSKETAVYVFRFSFRSRYGSSSLEVLRYDDFILLKDFLDLFQKL
jgi:hypothetical protein